MDEKIANRLRQDTAQLCAKLGAHETRNVMAAFSRYILDQVNNDDAPIVLSSAARQCAFAISVLASSPEPKNPTQFDNAAWDECVSLLERIFMAYVDMFMANAPSTINPSNPLAPQVAMQAFLHYFHAGLNASTDQVAQRIRTYLAPFDGVLERLVGLSATAALRICETITSRTESAWSTLIGMSAEEKRLRLALIDRWEQEGLEDHQVRHEAKANGYVDHFKRMSTLMDQLYRIDLTDLVNQFGSSGQAFWDQFSITRGEAPPVEYLTDRLSYDTRPLVRFNSNQAAFIVPHHIYTAVLENFEEALTVSAERDSYFKARDRIVETEVASALQRLFPGSTVYRCVFETPANQYEHDIIMVWEGTCIVAEVKASPPVEPFRDHEKAFERIRRAFRSNRGIQKAYEQACRVWERWARGETVTLFDRKGNTCAQISPDVINQFFLLCVTRDDYGPLATDLSPLLEKSPGMPYPWAPNILTLNHLIDGWIGLGLGAKEFLDFLRSRIQLHDKVFGSDELEFAGYYVHHRSMSALLTSECDRAVLNPSYSDVFDHVYLSKHGRPPVKIARTEPVVYDLREALLGFGTVPPTRPENRPGRRRQRPNDPCACSSGRKYKKCCGKK